MLHKAALCDWTKKVKGSNPVTHEMRLQSDGHVEIHMTKKEVSKPGKWGKRQFNGHLQDGIFIT